MMDSADDNNMPQQNDVNLGAQNDAATFNTNSLINDDFEVISSLSDALHSLSPDDGSEIPLRDIVISRNPTDSSENGAAVVFSNTESGDRTPLANNSLNLAPNGVADQNNTKILMQTVTNSSIVDGRGLSVQEDPISTVEPIRANYEAALQSTQQENELLRKACEKKSQQDSKATSSPEQPCAAQIIEALPGHQFRLNEELLAKILLHPDVADKKVCVISIAGAYRTGKSFLLNFILRYLHASEEARRSGTWTNVDDCLEGFSWRGGWDPTTTGILMWSPPFLVRNADGEEVALVLMDTQGAFDNRSTTGECTTIFALSTMISSLQIYNLTNNVQMDNLQHLQLFTEYGQLAMDGKKTDKPFQKFLFLVRDWKFSGSAEYGSEGGQKLLDRLQANENHNAELQQIVCRIFSCFEQIRCFLMPHPGLEASEGAISEIREQFREHLRSLVSSLVDPKHLVLKRIGGQNITCRELGEYIKAYMKVFQDGSLPEIKTLLMATAETYYLSVLSTAKKHYMKRMEEECDSDVLSSVNLQAKHEVCQEEAIDVFQASKEIGGAEFSEQFLEKLKAEIQEEYNEFLKRNEDLRIRAEKQNELAVSTAKNHYVWKTESNCGDRVVSSSDLAEIHEQYREEAISLFNTTKKEGGAEFSKQFLDKLQESIEEEYKKLIEQNNSLRDNAQKCNEKALREALADYERKMKEECDNNVLSLKNLQTNHEVCQIKAMDVFQSSKKVGGAEFSKQFLEKLKAAIQEEYNECRKRNEDLRIVAEEQNELAVSTAKNHYVSKAGLNCGDRVVSSSDLAEIHEQCREEAISLFNTTKKEGGAEFSKQFLDKLQGSIEEEYKKLTERNSSLKNKAKKCNEEALREALSDYETKMKEECDNNVRSSVDLQAKHNVCQKEAIDIFQASEKVGGAEFSKQFLEKLKAAIQEKYNEFVKRNGDLRIRAEKQNESAVSMAKNHYFSKMELNCGDRALSSTDLGKVHEKFRKEAISLFNSTEKEGGAEFSKQFLDKLQRSIEEEYEKLTKRNDLLRVEAKKCNELALQEAVAHYTTRMEEECASWMSSKDLGTRHGRCLEDAIRKFEMKTGKIGGAEFCKQFQEKLKFKIGGDQQNSVYNKFVKKNEEYKPELLKYFGRALEINYDCYVEILTSEARGEAERCWNEGNKAVPLFGGIIGAIVGGISGAVKEGEINRRAAPIRELKEKATSLSADCKLDIASKIQKYAGSTDITDLEIWLHASEYNRKRLENLVRSKLPG